MVNNCMYDSVERYCMLMKTKLFGDSDMAQKMRNPKLTIDHLKQLGHHVMGFDKDVWSVVSPINMLVATHAKFTQNAQLGQLLLCTDDSILVEGSPYDTIWDAGMDMFQPMKKDSLHMWLGKNRYGVVLMVVRAHMRCAQLGRNDRLEEEVIPSSDRLLVTQLVKLIKHLHTTRCRL